MPKVKHGQAPEAGAQLLAQDSHSIGRRLEKEEK